MWCLWAVGIIGGLALLCLCLGLCRAASDADDWADEMRRRMLADALNKGQEEEWRE